MKIEIDLSTLAMDSDASVEAVLREEVVAAAARLLADRMAADAASARKEVSRVALESVREQVAAHVSAAMAAPIRRMTKWGEPQGEPVSLLELIREELEAFLAAPAKYSRESRNGRLDPPRNLGELIADEVRAVTSDELRKDLAAVKREIVDKIREKALSAAVAALV